MGYSGRNIKNPCHINDLRPWLALMCRISKARFAPLRGCLSVILGDMSSFLDLYSMPVVAIAAVPEKVVAASGCQFACISFPS